MISYACICVVQCVVYLLLELRDVFVVRIDSNKFMCVWGRERERERARVCVGVFVVQCVMYSLLQLSDVFVVRIARNKYVYAWERERECVCVCVSVWFSL